MTLAKTEVTTAHHTRVGVFIDKSNQKFDRFKKFYCLFFIIITTLYNFTLSFLLRHKGYFEFSTRTLPSTAITETRYQ